MYGLSSDDKWITDALVTFIILFTVEMCVLVWVYGPEEFWHFSQFHPDINFVTYVHRSDMVILILTLLMYMVAMNPRFVLACVHCVCE